MPANYLQQAKAEIPRSSFDRSHGHKTTIDGGILYPIFLDEVLPGDTFNLKMHAVARMSTPIFPIMDNIYIDTQFFFVPNRLLWSNWERFNGAQDNPADSTDFVPPYLVGASGLPEKGLGDYFGLPISTGVPANISSLPFRAYNLIWNEWYRDQNLQNSAYFVDNEGPDDISNFPLRARGKRHDYFTSCLPWPQKGPGADVPVIADPVGLKPKFLTASGTVDPFVLQTNSGTKDVIISSTSATASNDLEWAEPNLVFTINELREAYQIQKIFERDARGGTRYTEIIRSHFGVTSPDARLQRPEYLGGGSQAINISQIHQTSGTAGAGGYTDTPLGQVGAIGTAVLSGSDHAFTQSFTEHGYIIGLVSVRADMTYQNKVDRHWSRQTRFDYYWPALAHIGEQAVLNREIYFQDAAPDLQVFGYQERYGEYRFKPSQVSGLFRSEAGQSLDAWHLAYDFAAPPALNDLFIQENPPLDRVVAVPAEPKFILDTWFQLQCARPMPMFGTPGLSDHF